MDNDNAWKTDAEGYFIELDVGEKKDYALDWTEFLAGDVIATVVWTVPAGVTKVQQAQTTTTGQVWLQAKASTPDDSNHFLT